jgi:phenylacetyl-CoA:acceptor oxidoreductase subunit 2
MSFGPNPWQQRHWDWRAAGNFVCGGMGSGLIAFAALAGAPRWLLVAGAALVALGLFAVWLEIGRPWRSANVVFNPQTSWMSREALVAPVVFAAVAAAWWGVPGGGWLAAFAALAFVYCQARILQAATGIPAWREPRIVPLIVATGLAEGGGLFLLLSAGAAWMGHWAAFAMVLVARVVFWSAWRQRLRAAPRALAEIDRAGALFKAATLLPLAAAVAAAALPATSDVMRVLAGVAAAAGGVWFKFTLVTRCAFNQGFALVQLPVRGVPRS